MKAEEKLGAWSLFTCKIDEQAQEAFKEATHGMVGADYSPVAVSQQVVGGMNYRFFCNAKLVTPFSLNGAAIVCVFKPATGKAIVTSIIPIPL
jgi:hypothetical protein